MFTKGIICSRLGCINTCPHSGSEKGEILLGGTFLGSGNSINRESHWPEEDLLIGQLQQ